jgi:hypothetical protein
MRRQRVLPRAEPVRSRDNADYPEADMREPHTNTSDDCDGAVVMNDGFGVLRVQEGDRRKDFVV